MTIFKDFGFEDLVSKKTISALFDIAKKHFATQQLSTQISDYMERYKAVVFERLLNDEAFDWEGLEEFLEEAIPMLCTCFLLPLQATRTSMKHSILNRAYSKTQANTVAQQLRVNDIIYQIG